MAKERLQALYLLLSLQANSITRAVELIRRDRTTVQRWIVERTWSWLENARSLTRDTEIVFGGVSTTAEKTLLQRGKDHGSRFSLLWHLLCGDSRR